MNPQNPEENKAQFPQPTSANVSSLPETLRGFIPQQPAETPPPAAVQPPTPDAMVAGSLPPIPSTEIQPTANIASPPTAQAAFTPEGAAPVISDSTLGKVQAAQTPETPQTASQQLDPNILSYDPNALPKIGNSVQDIPVSPEATTQTVPANPNFTPSSVVEPPVVSGTPGVITTNPDYIPPREKAPPYVDMPNAEPLTRGEQNAVSQMQQSNSAENIPAINNSIPIETPSNSQIITPIGLDGKPILTPSQTTGAAPIENTALQPASQNSTYPSSEGTIPSSFPASEQKDTLDQAVVKPDTEKAADSSTLNEYKLPDGIMERLKQVEAEATQGWPIVEEVVKGLEENPKKMFEILRQHAITKEPIEELLKAA